MLQFSVVRKLRNRLHVKVSGHRFTEAEAAYVEDTLLLNDAIVDVKSPLNIMVILMLCVMQYLVYAI